MNTTDAGQEKTAILANFLVTIYGQKAFAEARRRALKHYDFDTLDVGEAWSAVCDELARRMPKHSI